MPGTAMDRRSWFRSMLAPAALAGFAAQHTDAAEIGPNDNLKVTKIESFVLRNSWVFVKISTDAGIVGWGEMLKDDAKACAAGALAGAASSQEDAQQTMWRRSALHPLASRACPTCARRVRGQARKLTMPRAETRREHDGCCLKSMAWEGRDCAEPAWYPPAPRGRGSRRARDRRRPRDVPARQRRRVAPVAPRHRRHPSHGLRRRPGLDGR